LRTHFDRRVLTSIVANSFCGKYAIIDIRVTTCAARVEVEIMPSYEYGCKDCGKDFLIFLSLKEMEAKPKITCPLCGSDHVEKKFGAFFAKTSKKS